jgi:hypothetical protein
MRRVARVEIEEIKASYIRLFQHKNEWDFKILGVY